MLGMLLEVLVDHVQRAFEHCVEDLRNLKRKLTKSSIPMLPNRHLRHDVVLEFVDDSGHHREDFGLPGTEGIHQFIYLLISY